MRFVWAVAAFFLAAVLIGVGIAQRTIFMGPTSEQSAISVSEELPYTLIDGAVLNRLPGAQTLMARGDGTIFAAYGRTTDMRAWLSDAEYNAVTVEGGEIVTTAMEPDLAEPDPAAGAEGAAPEEGAVPEEGTAPAEGAVPAEEAPTAGRDPIGSDLWLDEFQQEDALIAPLQLPEDMSVLVAADGTAAAPSDLTVSWPLDNATPWAGPLIAAGGVLMLIGVLLYLLGIRHARRSRGPRRKGLPPLAETQPIDISLESADKGVVSAGPSRRAVASGRRAFAIVPVVAVSALLFSGCSADAWPELGPTPTPSASPSIIVPEGQEEPAVTRAQAERILARVAATAAEADGALDPARAAERLDGAVLAERATNYVLRAAIPEQRVPAPIPAKPLEIVLPEASDEWPRTFMAVVEDEADPTVPPTIMVLGQEDAWSPYKLSHLASMPASAVMPRLAPTWLGAVQVSPDSSFLAMAPQQVAAAYADILNNGEQSPYFDAFDEDGDAFRVQIAEDRQTRLAGFNETAATTGTLTFAAAAGQFEPIALATLESGAIVALTITESDTVTPTSTEAVIKVDGNPTVRALTGVDQSATGFTRTDSDQIFFYVPGQGSNEKIQLLGYGSNILEAKVIP